MLFQLCTLSTVCALLYFQLLFFQGEYNYVQLLCLVVFVLVNSYVLLLFFSADSPTSIYCDSCCWCCFKADSCPTSVSLFSVIALEKFAQTSKPLLR